MAQSYQAPTSSDSLATAVGTLTADSLEALRTVHSGGSAPSSTVAYMLWADTGTGWLQIRNSADSAWIAVAPLASAWQIGTFRHDMGAVSATTTAERLFVAPAACTITRIGLIGDTATTSSSGNEWQFSLDNVTQTLALFSATVGTYTALGGVGGGAELAADTIYDLTPDQNTAIAQGDVLDFTLTAAGTATALGDLQLFIVYQLVS
jgi:hypothetical protein